ncbi:MAG: hypothetical protein GF349_03405 [Candidatus Magasanikbacteria bacterium]|nr:hypothetical protein [Candidatus Magasanikbacteria bacterium]
MKVVCINCGRITTREGDTSITSHGYCPTCHIAVSSQYATRDELKEDIMSVYEKLGEEEWLPNDGSPYNKKVEITDEDRQLYDEIMQEIRNEKTKEIRGTVKKK